MITITLILAFIMALSSCEAGLFDRLPTSVAAVAVIAGLIVASAPKFQPLFCDAVGIALLFIVVAASGAAYHIILRNLRPLTLTGEVWRQLATVGNRRAWGWASNRLAFCIAWR